MVEGPQRAPTLIGNAMRDYRESHIESGDGYDSELAASPFDAYMDHWEAIHLRQMVEQRFGRTVPRYLDFACGTGRLTAVVAPLAEQAVGVDISPSMLEIARTKVPSATFVEGDLTKEKLKLGEFDLITSFRFLGNAQQELREAALSALNALQPIGATLIINNHRNPNSLSSLITRLRGGGTTLDLTHRRLNTLLRRCGYQIVASTPIGAWQYRARLLAAAGSDPRREEKLERTFGSSIFVPIAPDAIIVAHKVGTPDLG